MQRKKKNKQLTIKHCNLLFLVHDKYLLYTGEFTEYRSVLLDAFVIEQIKNELIEDVFIDTTLISSEISAVIKACNRITEVLK